MAHFHAEVPTEHGSRYLQQLCKHWSHRFEVTFDAEQGRIDLNGTPCRLRAEPQRLLIDLDGGDARLCSVVAEHLKRFAFREEMEIGWVEVDTIA
jgi:hypothetical protein